MSFADWVNKYGDPATRGSWMGPKVPWADCCRQPVDDGDAAWLQHLNNDHPPGERYGGHFLVIWYRSGTHPV